MKYEDIKNEISGNIFKQVYLFYGDDEYLKQSVVNALKTAIIRYTQAEYDNVKFDDTSKIEDIINECATYSFSGNNKFITCRNTGFFNKEEFSDKIISLSDYVTEGVYLFFIENDINKRLSGFKHYTSKNSAYEITKGTAEDIKRFVYSAFRKEGKNISSENLNLFLEYSGLNLSFVTLSIDKILLYIQPSNEVTAETIKLLCTGITDVKGYELTNNLCKRDLSAALDVYYDMVSLKYVLPYFTAILFNTFYEMYTIKVNNITSSNDFRVRKAIQNSKEFSTEQLKNIIYAISEADHDFKSGKLGQDSAMVTLMSTIVNS